MTVTADEKKEIKRKGFASIGRQEKTLYYRPDGTEVYSYPSWLAYTVIENGKVKGEERIDRKITEKGWSLTPPENPKITCKHCMRYHDTQAEIAECEKVRQDLYKKHETVEKKGELESRVDGVEKSLDEIKEMLNALAKAMVP